MRMALLGILNVRIDAPLEDLLIVFRLSAFSMRSSSQMNICMITRLALHGGGVCHVRTEECRYVAEVENQCIAQLDWLGQELFVRDHGLRHNVPCSPEILKFLKSWDSVGRVL